MADLKCRTRLMVHLVTSALLVTSAWLVILLQLNVRLGSTGMALAQELILTVKHVPVDMYVRAHN